MSDIKIIGLSGYAHAGKDEVGRILVEKCGYVRFAKGDLIKTAAYAIDPVVIVAGMPTRLADLVDTVGWEEAKMSDDVRRFLQNLPDMVVRVLGSDVWNDALYDSIIESGCEKVVLTRMCLPYELDALFASSGVHVRVSREGFGPVNDHPNEVALDGAVAHWYLENNGTLDDLETQVIEMAETVFLPMTEAASRLKM